MGNLSELLPVGAQSVHMHIRSFTICRVASMYWAPTHGLAFRVDIQVYVYDLGHYDAQA